jgi:shikimate kinase
MARKCIFIVGYMGSGKSTGGRRLARAMGYRFTDMDAALVEETGMSISGLFEALGEAGFRDTERRLLHRLSLENEAQVVATGGGTPCFEDNMDFMLEHGRVVQFKVELASLLDRLRARRKQRPLIADIPDDELEAFIQSHLARRAPFYDRAHINVDADVLDSERLASIIRMIDAEGLNP